MDTNVFPTEAQTNIYVSTTGNDSTGDGSIGNPFLSIQKGIDTASAGDTVIVLNGTYRENIVLKNGVNVSSLDGNASTVIDGMRNGSVVTAININPSINFDGFTIRNGSACDGGGMYIRNSSLAIANCNFSNNQAPTGCWGGGIYAGYSSFLNISNCTFRNNEGNFGGGLHNKDHCSVVLTNCSFLNNIADNSGGAIYNDDWSTVTLIGCNLSDNSALYWGGGIASSDWSNIVMMNCSLDGNEADEYDGGGISSSGSSSLTLSNCNISNNTANRDAGAIEISYGCSAVLTVCNLSFNSVLNGNGGAIYSSDSTMNLIGCNLWNNSAPEDGGAVYIKGSSLNIGESYIWNNSANDGGAIYSTPASYTAVPSYFNISDSTIRDNHGIGIGSAGGGIFNNMSQAILFNCNISSNWASYDGGGMWNYNSSPTLTDCTFGNNTANQYWGGGMYNKYYSSPALTNCSFVSNRAGSLGGGICNDYYCAPTLSGCSFRNNSAICTGGSCDPLQRGGGIYNGGLSSPTLFNCSFENNSAATAGGGMCNYNVDTSLYNCNFFNNTAPDGGGIANDASSPKISGCILWNNSASEQGGGIYNEFYSYAIITNCDLWNNSAADGGGIYNYRNSSATITNCILWDDSPDEIVNNASSPFVGYCDIKGDLYSGTGNINSSPMFADPSSGNFRLQDSSPCIDAGNNSAPSAPLIDLDGYPRPLDGNGDSIAIIDMGAYESHPTPVDIWVNDDWKINSSMDIVYWEGNLSQPHLIGYDAFAKIQDGIDSVPGSVRVHVADGIYYEHVVLQDGDELLGGGVDTIVDGTRNGSGITGMNLFNTTRIDSFTIINGSADYGGGLHLVNSTLLISNCNISNNLAGYDGGGTCIDNSSASITNCTFWNNSAADDAGGIDVVNGSILNITNCTFFNNSAIAGNGGGINGTNSSTITNCILWQNSPDQINPAGLSTVSYSDTKGTLYPGSGNINASPIFADAAKGNFHLTAASPCIDAGNNSAPAIPATDFENDARIIDAKSSGTATVDMGVDEAAVYTLTINTSPGAGGSPAGAGTYISGTDAAISADTDPCYTFTGWSPSAGVADPNAENTTIAMTQNRTVNATYSIKTYTVNYTASAHGNISLLGNTIVNCGDTPTYDITPDHCYHIDNVSVNGTSVMGSLVGDLYSFAQYTFPSVENDSTINATFAINTYTLNLSVNGSGSIDAVNGSFNCDNIVAFNATPIGCWHFVNWSGDTFALSGAATNASNAANMSGNVSLTANFAINQYTLTIAQNGSGTIIPGVGTHISNCNEIVTVNATPAACWHFVNWTGNTSALTSSATNASNSVNTSANVSLTANFAINQHTLTISSSTGGNATFPGEGTFPYDCGNVVVLNATTAPCYHFVNWSGDTGNISNVNNPNTSITVNGNYSIQANFAITQYTLTYNASAGGSITGNASQVVNCGTDGSQVTAVPDNCYHFVNWSDGVLTASRTDTNIHNNIAITANFAVNKYTLTYNIYQGGAINGATAQTVNCGENGSTVAVVPDTCYNFVRWDDGVTTASRTDTNITGNLTVTALMYYWCGGGGGTGYTAPPSTLDIAVLDKLKTAATDGHGLILQDTVTASADGKTTVHIPADTLVLDSNGNPLTYISINPISSYPEPPDGRTVIAAFNFQPSGAAFNPGIEITLTYDPAALPAGFGGSQLVIAFYNEAAGQWQYISGTVNPDTNTITFLITHFTVFAIMAPQASSAAPSATPKPASATAPNSSSTSTALTTPTLIPTATPAAMPNPTSIATPVTTPSGTANSNDEDNGLDSWICIIVAGSALFAVLVGTIVIRTKKQ